MFGIIIINLPFQKTDQGIPESTTSTTKAVRIINRFRVSMSTRNLFDLMLAKHITSESKNPYD
jgi:molybdate-binding protein